MSTTALMTFAEFERLPDIPGKQELVDGEILIMPPPELIHSEICKRIFLLLIQTLDSSRIWTDHTGYRIRDGWIEPDVSVSWPDQPRDDKYFLHSPMVAVEVLSKGEDIERKLTLYFAEGAQEVWVVDPRHRALTVYLNRRNEVIRISVDRDYYSEAAQVTISPEQLFL